MCIGLWRQFLQGRQPFCVTQRWSLYRLTCLIPRGYESYFQQWGHDSWTVRGPNQFFWKNQEMFPLYHKTYHLKDSCLGFFSMSNNIESLYYTKLMLVRNEIEFFFHHNGSIDDNFDAFKDYDNGESKTNFLYISYLNNI